MPIEMSAGECGLKHEKYIFHNIEFRICVGRVVSNRAMVGERQQGRTSTSSPSPFFTRRFTLVFPPPCSTSDGILHAGVRGASIE